MGILKKLMAGGNVMDEFLCKNALILLAHHVSICPDCKRKLDAMQDELPMLENIIKPLIRSLENGESTEGNQ